MSNTEAKVLTAVLRDKQVHVLMQANVDGLLHTHNDVWEFIRSYVDKNGSVPPENIVVDNFKDFEPVPSVGTTKHHLEQLQSEYMDIRIREILRGAAAEVQEGKPADAINTLISQTSDLKKTTSSVKDLDLVDVDSAIAHFEMVQKMNSMGSYGIKTGLPGFDSVLPSGITGGMLGVFLAYPGIGKPTTLDTPVATPDGWVRKGDLKVGDLVISRRGKPTRVLATIDQGTLDAYRVTLSDNTSVIVGPDHDWTVYTRDTYYNSKKTFVKTTTELMGDLHYKRSSEPNKRPFDKYILPLVEPVEYSQKDFPVDPYTLGVLLGDGSISKQPIFVVDDKEIADRVKKNNPSMKISKHKKFDGAGQRYAILGLHKTLRELGVAKLSGEKRVPEEYLFGSVKQRLELLRGLMDTDGSCVAKKRPVFHSYNEGLANDVAELVRSLGGVARVDTYRDGIEYSVKMRLPFNPFNLERKSKNYVAKAWARSIRSIEHVGKREMRCISVEDHEHLYAVNDYIMTHNSWLAMYFAAQAWKQDKKPLIISLEMSEAEVRNRLFTVLGDGIWSLRKMGMGEVELDMFKRWHAKTFTDKPPFYIVSSDNDGEVNPSVVKAKVDQYKPDFVILDYLQLMSPNTKTDNEVTKMKNLSRELKQLARGSDVPILAISSATPDDVTNLSQPPTLGQTAWSRQIAYDADWLLSLGRDPNSDIVTAVHRKNRHGPMNEFYIQCDFDSGRFIYVDDPDN